MFCYLNDRLLPLAEARLPVTDRGYLLGEGLFETMGVRAGKVSFLNRHLLRLRRGAAVLDLPLPPDEVLIRAVRLVGEANRLREGVLRLTVSATDRPSGSPTVLVTARDGAPYPEEIYETGMRVAITGIRIDEKSPLCGVKSLNRLLYTLAGREAAAGGADEGLLLNSRGEVAECTRSNIFWITGRELYTPAAACGLLPGIAREVILEEAGRIGLGVNEVCVGPEAVGQADECFLTNSLLEVMPVTVFAGTVVGSGVPGPSCRILRRLYREKALA